MGFCLCGDSGDKVWSLRNSFYGQLKRVSPRHSFGRSLVQTQFLAAKWHGSREKCTDPLERSLAELTGEEHLADLPSVEMTVWWHISNITFCPYTICSRAFDVCDHQCSPYRVAVKAGY